MKKIIIFDFDGTIVDSNEIKNRAYLELFPLVSQRAKDGIEKISKGSRKTRYQIIREILVFLKDLGEIKIDDVEKETQKRAEIWGEIVEKNIINGKEVPGAFEALKFFHDKGYALYILSGTPQEPLRKIVGEFVKSGKIPPVRDVRGRIDDMEEKKFKEEVIAEVMKKELTEAEQITLVGDGNSERDAALEMGCTFIGVANDSNKWNLQEKGFIILKDLTDLVSLFREGREEKRKLR